MKFLNRFRIYVRYHPLYPNHIKYPSILSKNELEFLQAMDIGLLIISLTFVTITLQLLFTLCRRIFPGLFKYMSFIMVWMMPMMLNLQKYPFFFLSILLYTTMAAYLLSKSVQRPIERRTIGILSHSYYFSYMLSKFLGTVGVMTIMINIMIFWTSLLSKTWIFHAELLLQGVYFSAYGELVTKICCDFLSADIQFYLRDHPGRRLDESHCTICNEVFPPNHRVAGPFVVGRNTILRCGHKVHDHCLQLWFLLGQSDRNPCCSRNTQLIDIQPWSHSLTIYGIMVQGANAMMINPIFVLCSYLMIPLVQSFWTILKNLDI